MDGVLAVVLGFINGLLAFMGVWVSFRTSQDGTSLALDFGVRHQRGCGRLPDRLDRVGRGARSG